MEVEGTGAPSVSMRLGNDHADRQKRAKQFNEEINQAKEATDDDVSSSETAPQRKAIGGSPTTQSVVDSGPRQFTDEQIYAGTKAAEKRIDPLADAKAQVLDSFARIDGIVALPDRPGFFAMMRGSEQIVLTSEEVAQLRASAEKSLDAAAKQARGRNETTFERLNDHMKLNYKEHPYVGFAVSGVSGEKPVELYDRVQPMVATSNSTLTSYRQQTEAGAPLAKRAAILLEGVEGAERARVTLDKGVDRAMSATGDIVTGLTITRDLSFAVSLSLGAVVAAPVVAAGVGAGAGGLGLTGAGAVAATGVGTGAVVGAGGFALRGGSAVAGELAAGHSLEQAASVGWQEGKRGAKEGFVSGVGGGVGHSTGRALGLGAQQLSRAQTIARSVASGSAGGGSSELARGIIEQRGVVDTLKGTGKGLVLGGGGGLIGGASSTIPNPVLRHTAAIGGDVALNTGVAYAETGSVREAALAGASSIAVSGSVAAARQHPPGTGTGAGSDAAGKAHAFENDPVYIRGQETRPATPAEAERYNAGMRQGGIEIAFVERRDGSQSLIRGDTRRVKMPDGPEIKSGSHTHPNGPAIFSGGDARRYITGDYASDVEHSVTGEKWPAANRVLREEPGAEPSTELMTTVARQSSIDTGGASPSRLWSMLRGFLREE